MRLVSKVLRGLVGFLYFWGSCNFDHGLFTRSMLRNVSVLRTAGFVFDFATNWIVTVAYFALIVLIITEGVTRYVMRGMPMGIEEVALIFAAWMFFIGISLATRDNRQITVSIINMIPIPKVFHRPLDIAGDVISVVIAGYFAYITVLHCWHVQEHGFSYEPFTFSSNVQIGAVGLGMTLMTIYLLRNGIRRIRRTGGI